ncbi:MAG: hypothetical protein Crog4KO_11750 [Crocinitomicaceae bacterium]
MLLSLFSTSYASCVRCTDLSEAFEKPYDVKYLDLSGQGLTRLPDSLNKFTNLISLNLADNQISEMEFGTLDLEKLEVLNLNFNPGINMIDVSGIALAVPNLKELHLRKCSMFLLSPEIGTLKKLDFLDVSNNKLRSLPSALENCALKKLTIRNNDLDGALWAMELWNLKNLDVSGNPKLSLDALGHALLFKELNQVIVAPSEEQPIPKIFNALAINTLVVAGGTENDLAKSIPSNKNIRSLVFQGTSIDSELKFYAWLNSFESLESIDFVNMELPNGVSRVKSAKYISMDLCQLDQPNELEGFSQNVTVRMINMSDPLSVSNEKPNNLIADVPLGASKEMIANKVSEIIAPETFEETIDPKQARFIQLQNTSYAIPKNAFLTQSGDVYKGDVKLEIREYNDAITNALAGAPMAYREGGTNQIFSSSGMFEFNAYDENGEKLAPNPENIIEVEMVDLQPSEQTRLYVFNEEENNWEDVGEAEQTGDANLRQKILDSLNKIPDAYFFTINTVSADFTMDVDRSRYDPYEFSFNMVREGYIPEKFNYGRDRSKEFEETFENQRWLTERRRVFVVDTIMTEELKEALIDLKKDGRKRARYYRRNTEEAIDLPIPGTMRDIKLTPNYEGDNYILTFKYKADLIRIPVTFKDKGNNIQKIQRKEKERFIAYDKVKGSSLKAQDKFQKDSEEKIREGAQRLRDARADLLSSPEYIEMKRREQERAEQQRLWQINQEIYRKEQEEIKKQRYRLGLQQFGMINCDFFSRVIPSGYVRSAAEAMDQNGDTIRVPESVRNIIIEDNVYLSNDRDRIPLLENKKSILFFAIGAAKIAVIVGWEKLSNGLSRPKIETHDIENKTPVEVRNILKNSP